MALNWKVVRVEHVQKACEVLLAGQYPPRVSAKGLYVVFHGRQLPAKHVMRLAYCLANNLPLDTNLKFSSGEGTLKRLRDFGFKVERSAFSSIESGRD